MPTGDELGRIAHDMWYEPADQDVKDTHWASVSAEYRSDWRDVAAAVRAALAAEQQAEIDAIGAVVCEMAVTIEDQRRRITNLEWSCEWMREFIR